MQLISLKQCSFFSVCQDQNASTDFKYTHSSTASSPLKNTHTHVGEVSNRYPLERVSKVAKQVITLEQLKCVVYVCEGGGGRGEAIQGQSRLSFV